MRRPGRITRAQERALEKLWPRWGIDFAEGRLDLDEVFGRRSKRVLDVGFGDGEALLTSAAHNTAVDFLGVEVHEPGIGHLLMLLERAELANVRIVRRDVVDVVEKMLPTESIDVVNLFFPDPWPKKRHHKRRLIQAEFLVAIEHLLRPGGFVHIATDSADYAEHAEIVFSAVRGFQLRRGLDTEDLAFRPPTKFERRGRRLGHDVVDLYYSKSTNDAQPASTEAD